MQTFTEQEAWNLFKIAAISEAAGWTLLIGGILVKQFITPASDTSVQLTGKIHGTLFLLYILAVFVLYASLGWSRKRSLIASLASVPPYGSLLFEQWAAYKRRGRQLKNYREVIVRGMIIKGDSLVAIQPQDNGYWNLPGGIVQSGENAEEALQRLVLAQTGVLPSIERLVYILQYREKSTERLELFFKISNTSDFREQDLKAMVKRCQLVDDIRYMKSPDNKELRPVFLQAQSTVSAAKKPQGSVTFLASP